MRSKTEWSRIILSLEDHVKAQILFAPFTKMGSCFAKQRLPDGSAYKVVQTLGEGAFAKVLHVLDSNRRPSALKIVTVPSERLSEAEREAEILRKVTGVPHVAQLFNECAEPTENENMRVYILMKLYRGGTLVDYTQRYSLKTTGSTPFPPLTEDLLIPIIRQICQGIHNLHSLQPAIVHRDIKPENIVLDVDLPESAWTLLDFGSAVFENSNPLNTKKEVADATEELDRYTTPVYRAPEQINLTIGRRITRKVDIWALGVTIYQVAYRKLPFESTLATVSGRVNIPSQPAYSLPFTNLLQMLFTLDPEKRPDIVGVVGCLDQFWDSDGHLKSLQPQLETSKPAQQLNIQQEWTAEFD